MEDSRPQLVKLKGETARKGNVVSGLTRRKFLGLVGSGLTVTFVVTQGLEFPWRQSEVPVDAADPLNAWINISEAGNVTIFTGKAEVGQNIRTSLAQVVAEELKVPMSRIEMVMGDTALTPYDRGTFGSLSTPQMGPLLRKAAATAREALIDMAAAEWNVDRASLVADDGEVRSQSLNKSISFGQLTKGKPLTTAVNDKIALTPADQWKVAGTSVPKVNGASFVTGRHKYVSDMALPGMLHGKILRAPSYGATIASAELEHAKGISGVTVVHEGNFVGVAAPDISTANRALKAIEVVWNTTPQPSRSDIFEFLKKHGKEPRDVDTKGDAAAAFGQSELKLDQTFLIDYIAHAPLEPRAGLAQWEGEKLTVWTGTQRPFGVQEDLAGVFKIGKENIRVIQPDTGSGYGGKHTGEAGVEAARLAKAAGKPVKLVWTREEEFTWAYFRPAGVIEVKAGVSKAGVLTAWDFHNYNSGPSGLQTPYIVADRKIQFHPVDSPLRQGSYRGLAATANVFARECMINDLAVEANVDPFAFRMKNLREQRMKDVLQTAVQGWPAKMPPGRGIGIACGDEKGSFIATAAEVEVSSEGEIRVVRVTAVFECGAIINPNHLENQIQGSVIQGMGGALFERIDFKDGKILNAAFSKYRVPRFGDMPKLEVIMLNRNDIASLGAGETPILAIAPAIRNAIYNATGRKLYSLPLVPNGLTS